MKRCHIFAGGDLGKIDRSWFSTHHGSVICADSGYKHAVKLGLEPDIIVGDFDSYDNPQLDGIETIVLPTVKDETDTAFAASEALRRGFDDFLIVGAIGARLDHTLVNISLLYKLYKEGCNAVLLDDYSEMTIAGKEPSYIDGSYKFFSLFNMFGPTRGITITGAKYDLEGAEITPEAQYATSNEVATGGTACVTVGEGELLLVKISRDMSDL